MRNNLLEEIFHAWLGIIYNFDIEFPQSQQDPVLLVCLMAIQGSQVQNLSEDWGFLVCCWFGLVSVFLVQGAHLVLLLSLGGD